VAKEPLDITERYSAREMASDPAKCHYDNMRENGFPHDAARRIARRAGDITSRTLDEKEDTLAHRSGSHAPEDAGSGAGAPPSFPWLQFRD
jgi:hypothetical protein